MQPPPLPPLNCQLCGRPAEPGYSAQLCSICRKTLSKRPFPIWIKICVVLIAVIFVYALTQMLASLTAFERGQKAEAAGNYETAASNYADAVERFPQSTLAIARLGIAQYRAGNRVAAIQTLNLLAGRQVPKELTTEVNAVIAEMQRQY